MYDASSDARKAAAAAMSSVVPSLLSKVCSSSVFLCRYTSRLAYGRPAIREEIFFGKLTNNSML